VSKSSSMRITIGRGTRAFDVELDYVLPGYYSGVLDIGSVPCHIEAVAVLPGYGGLRAINSSL